jgi:glycosyltransferase involved in cell wall biosynthesis
MSKTRGDGVLRIAQVVTSRGWGGRELVPLLLAQAFCRLGHQAEVWADPEAPAGREAERMGLVLRPLRFRGYLAPGEWKNASGHLRAFRPDILHLHEGKDLWAAVPGLRLAGSPARLVFTQHVGNAHPKKDPFHRLLYGRVDLLLACSDVIRRNAIRTCPVPPERVRTVYEPVDTQRYSFNPSGRRRMRNQWKRGAAPLAGMAARLTPGKGHELLLEAAALVLRKCPRARFVVAGGAAPEEQAYARALEKKRDGMGLRGFYDFIGHVRDMPAFWSAVDVAVHAAHAEAFGMAPAEALSCGRPVVAWDGEGTAEILRLRDGKVRGGVLVGPYEPAPWADAIASLLKSPSRWEALSRQARPMAERFSLDRFVASHLDAYGNLLGKTS